MIDRAVCSDMVDGAMCRGIVDNVMFSGIVDGAALLILFHVVTCTVL